MEDLSNYPNPYEVYDQNGTNHFGDSNYGSADGGYDSGSFGSNEGFDSSNQYVKDKFSSGNGESYGDYSNEYKDAYTRDSGSIEDDQEQRDRWLDHMSRKVNFLCLKLWLFSYPSV